MPIVPKSRLIHKIGTAGTVLFLLLVILYLIVSLLMIAEAYTNNSSSLAETLLNLFLWLIEILMLPFAISLILHVFAALSPRKDLPTILRTELDAFPKLSIVLSTRNPNPLALETNFLKAKRILYENVEIVVTDNSDNDAVPGIQELCARHHVKFFHRDGVVGFKARNLNRIFTNGTVTGKYALFIDIDQQIIPESIEKLIKILEYYPRLAFVQAKYKIMNATSTIRIIQAILYSFYYNILSLGKDAHETVLFNGTTACFRVAAILSVGGFPEETYCEDIDISVKLLLAGFKSRFLNQFVTEALVPWRLKDLLASMWRWVHGATSIGRLRTKEILGSNKISLSVKIELILNNFIWLGGMGAILFGICMAFLVLGNLNLLRPVLFLTMNGSGFNFSVGVVIPTAFAVISVIGSFLAIISDKQFRFILFLPVYGIASVSLFFFLAPAILYGLLGMRGPKSGIWNRNIRIFHYIPLLISLAAIFFAASVNIMAVNALQGLFFLTLFTSTIGPLIFAFHERKRSFEEIETRYFLEIKSRLLSR